MSFKSQLCCKNKKKLLLIVDFSGNNRYIQIRLRFKL